MISNNFLFISLFSQHFGDSQKVYNTPLKSLDFEYELILFNPGSAEFPISQSELCAEFSGCWWPDFGVVAEIIFLPLSFILEALSVIYGLKEERIV